MRLIDADALLDDLRKNTSTYIEDFVKKIIDRQPTVQPSTQSTLYGQVAIDAVSESTTLKYTGFIEMEMYTDDDAVEAIEGLPSAHPEIEIYSKMSDEEFEGWLRNNGICNPNVHASIPCDVVPLLIDSAIEEFLSAQPECEDAVSREAVLDEKDGD